MRIELYPNSLLKSSSITSCFVPLPFVGLSLNKPVEQACAGAIKSSKSPKRTFPEKFILKKMAGDAWPDSSGYPIPKLCFHLQKWKNRNLKRSLDIHGSSYGTALSVIACSYLLVDLMPQRACISH